MIRKCILRTAATSSIVIPIVAILFSRSEAFASIREPIKTTTTSVITRRYGGGNLIIRNLLRGGGKLTNDHTVATKIGSSELRMVPPSQNNNNDDNNNNKSNKSITIDNDKNDDVKHNSSGEKSTGQSNRSLVAGLFVSVLVMVTVAAKVGILRGPPLLDPSSAANVELFGLYTNSMIMQDIGSSILTAALGYVLVKLIQFGYNRELYNSKISRKLSHTLSAPLFILFFPLFSQADGSRFFAASVTFVNALRLYLAGTGGDSNLASTISRSGDKSEVLQGPFIYVCLFQLFILLFWRSSMVGVIAMSTMAAGDGMADIIGRKFGSNNKWPFSESKSIAGSTAFVVASSLTSIGLVNWLSFTGCLHYAMDPIDLAIRIVAISTICAIVELFPFVDDNYSVPITAAGLTALLLY